MTFYVVSTFSTTTTDGCCGSGTSASGNKENHQEGGNSPIANIFGLDHEINVQTRAHSYDTPPSVLDPSGSQPSSSLTIKKPTTDIVPRPPKGDLCKTTHIPNVIATQYYSIVKDLSQAPCAMLGLEVLQSF